MKEESTYNVLNALIYELITWLCRFYPLKRKPWIRLILKNCLTDWAAFRAELAIKDVDRQVKDLHAAWEREEKERQKPVYTELLPDGSRAQELLGGEMRLSSPWKAGDDA